MRTFYFLFFTIFCFTLHAQEFISFEEAEGYTLGSLHQQNGWEVTESDNDGVVQNQIITDEMASDGIYSFKNGFEPDYDWQFFPIFGASRLFDSPMDFTDGFSISYDILATDHMGSDFEMVVFAVDENDEWTPVAGVGTENRGFFYLIKDSNYGFEYADATWEPNEWNHIKIVVEPDFIDYYINGILEMSIPNFSQLDISGFNMLHNNFGADAYYDNFVIQTGEMSVDSFAKLGGMMYPNPAKNWVQIQITEDVAVEKVEVFNLLGQKLLEGNSSVLDVSAFQSGIYLVQIHTKTGSVFSERLIVE